MIIHNKSSVYRFVFLSKMNPKNNIILFFVLFTLKEFFSVSAEPVTLFLQYDITKLFDQWFTQLFTIDLNTVKAKESFFSSVNYKLAEYKFHYETEELLFKDVNFYMHPLEKGVTTGISKMTWNFPKNKICVLFSKLRITVESKLRPEKSKSDVTLFTTLNFENLTLCATVSPTNSGNISYDISYDNYYLYHYGVKKEVRWTGPVTNAEELTKTVKSALIEMLLENIKRNQDFTQTFGSLYRNYMQNEIKGVVSIQPATLTKKQKYYYLIPRVPVYSFSLKGLVIKGLSNVYSIEVYKKDDVFTHSLSVKNLRGNVILDYGSECEGAPEPLELYFVIDYLSISLRDRADCAKVKTKYYEFNSTKGPMAYRHSFFLMERIESAIVSSLMPSKRVCNIEGPVDKLKEADNTSKCNWETIKKAYKKWIPFPKEEGLFMAKTSLVETILQ